MQEAIRNYIEEKRKKDVVFEDIERIIDKVKRSEIKVAKQKQLRQWRKLGKSWKEAKNG